MRLKNAVLHTNSAQGHCCCQLIAVGLYASCAAEFIPKSFRICSVKNRNEAKSCRNFPNRTKYTSYTNTRAMTAGKMKRVGVIRIIGLLSSSVPKLKCPLTIGYAVIGFRIKSGFYIFAAHIITTRE